MTASNYSDHLGAHSSYRLSDKQKLMLASPSGGRLQTVKVDATEGNEEAAKQDKLLGAIAIGGFAAMFVLLVVLAQTGSPVTLVWLSLAALAPLSLVTATLFWIDRWAPIPWSARWVALAWGAGIAVVLAATLNTAGQMDVLRYTGSQISADHFVAQLVAPVVEETVKGLGVFLILWIARSRLTSVLSAASVGGLVGAGFAYTENIQYFLMAHAQGSAVLNLTMLGRGVFSPFIHPMATSLTGMAIGLVLLRRCRWYCAVPIVGVGFACAVALHSFWNFGASLGFGFIAIYLLVDFPVFLLWLISLLVASNKIRSRIVCGLSAYLRAGLITPQESALVLEKSTWRYSLKAARSRGGTTVRTLRKFRRLLGTLALLQATNHQTRGWLAGQVRQSQRCYEALLQARKSLYDGNGAQEPAGNSQ